MIDKVFQTLLHKKEIMNIIQLFGLFQFARSGVLKTKEELHDFFIKGTAVKECALIGLTC